MRPLRTRRVRRLDRPPTHPRLFAAAPWSTGYGIACGLDPHHLIGIDLDTKAGTDSSTTLRELALRHLFTIPDTVVVVSPRAAAGTCG